jgi:hypothetical protein
VFAARRVSSVIPTTRLTRAAEETSIIFLVGLIP